jgi:hypothetical protein
MAVLREPEPKDAAEFEAWSTRATAGAVLMAEGLLDLGLIRKVLSRER